MSDDLVVKVASWPADEARLRDLRTAVFVDEQGVPPAIEWDGMDAQAGHVIALRGDQTVGCGRLLDDGKIGRMAVLRQERGRGTGSQVMEALLNLARSRGMGRVYLHAQAQAEGFYHGAGFTPEGEPFEEAGIRHVAMYRAVDYRSCEVDVAPVAYPWPCSELVLALAQTASRQLDILSPTLDHAVFDSSELVRALTRLSHRGRASEVRILVQHARYVTARGHALLSLARRLPSTVSMRQLPEHPDWKGQTCVLRDRDGLLLVPADNPQHGIYRPRDRSAVLPRRDLFQELWRHGVQSPEFRAMHL